MYNGFAMQRSTHGGFPRAIFQKVPKLLWQNAWESCALEFILISGDRGGWGDTLWAILVP